MNARKIYVSLALLASLVVFVAAATPNLHHWDEFAYLYAAENYPITALVNGEFESSNVPGFFNVKIGHVALLRAIMEVFGAGLASIWISQAIYSTMIVLTGAALAAAMMVLHRTSIAVGLLAGGVLLLLPVNMYLCSKLLAETPAGLSAMLCVLLYAMALRAEAPLKRMIFAALSAVALVLTLYTRINFLVAPLGMGVALLLAPPPGLTRKNILTVAAMIGVFAGLVFALAEWVMELKLLHGLSVASVVSSQTLYWKAKIWKVIYAFGIFGLAASISVFFLKDLRIRFFFVWLVCASLPTLIAFSYIEVRWMAVAAPPLAALVVLCFERLWSRFGVTGRPGEGWKSAVAASLVLALAVGENVYIQPRTEIGFDSAELGRARSWVAERYPQSSVLIPWGWSTYHYLRVAYPSASVYLVNSSSFFSPGMYIQDAASWVAALSKWYGPHYVGSLAALRGIKERPFIVISRNRRVGGWNDLEQSWIAKAPELEKTEIHREGGYVVYLVKERSGGET